MQRRLLTSLSNSILDRKHIYLSLSNNVWVANMRISLIRIKHFFIAFFEDLFSFFRSENYDEDEEYAIRPSENISYPRDAGNLL